MLESAAQALERLEAMPRVRLGHTPTPLEDMPNLAAHVGGVRLAVKRDDCTGLTLGGNKVRQLEFYVGEAQARGADTILITGAVQSNFARLAAAAARKLGMDCHIQLEARVAKDDPAYRNSGNVLLDRMLGATLHAYPEGEDEAGADRRLGEIADGLARDGRRPYVIPLGPGHKPLGALGYVLAARELLAQIDEQALAIDEVVVPSGSGNTHAGLLFGLRLHGCRARVTGVCVRRSTTAQGPRIRARCDEIATLLGIAPIIGDDDVCLEDGFLAPGYGQLNEASVRAMGAAARCEGLILDPVYSSKAMAGLLHRAAEGGDGRSLVFLHTGGTPAAFAYEPELNGFFGRTD